MLSPEGSCHGPLTPSSWLAGSGAGQAKGPQTSSCAGRPAALPESDKLTDHFYLCNKSELSSHIQGNLLKVLLDFDML